MDDILTAIIKDTYSLAQFKHRVKLLKTTLVTTIFGNNKQNQSIPPLDLKWLHSLPVDFYKQFNKNNIYQIFTDLEKNSARLPILTMYLPFDADETAVSQIGMHARKNFSPIFLIDIRFDPKLIAGCALTWKGIMHDYSLKSKISQQKEGILQEFKKFLR